MESWKVVFLLAFIFLVVVGVALIAVLNARPSGRFLSPDWKPPEKSKGP